MKQDVVLNGIETGSLVGVFIITPKEHEYLEIVLPSFECIDTINQLGNFISHIARNQLLKIAALEHDIGMSGVMRWPWSSEATVSLKNQIRIRG